jgi:hypothetical protein
MTETDWTNLKALLLRVNLTGAEAITVAVLLAKIDARIAEARGISVPLKIDEHAPVKPGYA